MEQVNLKCRKAVKKREKRTKDALIKKMGQFKSII